MEVLQMAQKIIDFLMDFSYEIASLSLSTQIILFGFAIVTLVLLTKEAIFQARDLLNLVRTTRAKDQKFNRLIAEAEQRIQRIPVMVEGYSDSGIDPRELNPEYQNEDLRFK